MTQQTVLQISPREVTGKATKRLRKSGIIPANISGHKEESQAVQVEALAFEALRRAHAATSIITLRLSGSDRVQTALVRRVQYAETNAFERVPLQKYGVARRNVSLA